MPPFSFKPIIQVFESPVIFVSSSDLSLLAVPSLQPSSSTSSASVDPQHQQQQQQQPRFLFLDGDNNSLALPTLDDDDNDYDEDCFLTFMTTPVRLIPRMQPLAEDLYYY